MIIGCYLLVNQSCLLLTSQVLPDEFDTLIRTKRPVQYLKLEGLDTDAAMQLLAINGLNNQEKCNSLIKTYRGNPLELETTAKRIHHFFASSTEVFFENKTTFVSKELEKMLDKMFGEELNIIQRQIMIYLAEETLLTSKSVIFTKILNDLNQKEKVFISTSQLVKALEKLEILSLIESAKDPITKEISFDLQPVIKKYIETDPLGLVHTSDASPTLAFVS